MKKMPFNINVMCSRSQTGSKSIFSPGQVMSSYRSCQVKSSRVLSYGKKIDYLGLIKRKAEVVR